MVIKIQPDYWTGTKCVEYEVPWQTPESIYYLDPLCKPTDLVLEIGTGGSTFFFSRRCKEVVSIETDKNWYDIIQKQLKLKNITNVTYLYINEQKQIEEKLSTLYGFDILSVDSVHGYNRSSFLNIVLEKNKKSSTIVLDNYSDIVLFPEHYNKTISQLISALPEPNRWVGKDFNDPHWCGSGTRILNKV